MSGDRVIVTEPNGVQRSRPISTWGMTIGRGDDNDLVIGYGTVSRKHAVITAERGRYYVTDLNSTAGTFLGNVRLEPNRPTAWTPGQILQVGDVAIQLEQTLATDAKAETFHGVALTTGPFKKSAAAKPDKDNRALVWIIIAVVIICVLVALGVAAYYFIL